MAVGLLEVCAIRLSATLEAATPVSSVIRLCLRRRPHANESDTVIGNAPGTSIQNCARQCNAIDGCTGTKINLARLRCTFFSGTVTQLRNTGFDSAVVDADGSSC